MPVFGLNNGIIPIIAYNYGARNRARMVEAIKLAVIFAATYMGLGMIVFLTLPGALLSIFNASEAMLAIGIPALRIIGSTFLVAGACIALSSVFQAMGYGVYSMLVSIARQLLVLIPAAFILARIGQQAGNDSLVWFSFPVAEIISMLVTVYLFIRLYRNVISPIGESTVENAAA